MEKNQKRKFDIMDYFSVIRTIAALLLSMVIVFVIILFVSETPGLAIQKLMTGPLETKRSFFNVVVRAIPLVFTGLGLTLCLKSGIFNISSDASFYMGAVVATAIAISVPLPNIIHQAVLILAAAVVGGLISMLPVIVNKYTKVNPVYWRLWPTPFLYYFGLSIISTFFLEKSGSWGSYPFPDDARLGTMIKGTSLHYGFLVVIAATIFVIFLMNKTSFGYKVRVTGSNTAFAKVSGIRTSFVILMAQFIGGAIAGMGGAIEIVGVYRRFQWHTYIYSYTAASNGRRRRSMCGMVCDLYAGKRQSYLYPADSVFHRLPAGGSGDHVQSFGSGSGDCNIPSGNIILLVASQRFLYFIKKRHDQKLSLKQAEEEVLRHDGIL